MDGPTIPNVDQYAMPTLAQGLFYGCLFSSSAPSPYEAHASSIPTSVLSIAVWQSHDRISESLVMLYKSEAFAATTHESSTAI